MGDDGRPPGRFIPHEQSLDFAAHIAAAQGMPFDREATRRLGTNLYEAMFADLARVIDIDPQTLDFHSGVYPAARVFAASQRDGHPAVALDMIFDYWVFSLTHLVAILTFTVPAPSEQARIAADVDCLFDLYGFSGGFDAARGRTARYLTDARYQGQLLKIAQLLARASLVFILCHEIAHVRLGHLDIPATPEHELEADAKAVEYFRRVIEYGQRDRDTYIHIDPKMASGPLVFSMILELFEAWMMAKGADLGQASQHPPAVQRTAQLQSLMGSDLNDEALDIAVGATHAISGLHGLLGLPEPKVWKPPA